jgi:hypothetical protein
MHAATVAWVLLVRPDLVGPAPVRDAELWVANASACALMVTSTESSNTPRVENSSRVGPTFVGLL